MFVIFFNKMYFYNNDFDIYYLYGQNVLVRKRSEVLGKYSLEAKIPTSISVTRGQGANFDSLVLS